MKKLKDKASEEEIFSSLFKIMIQSLLLKKQKFVKMKIKI
jgi:hypothetical protein